MKTKLTNLLKITLAVCAMLLFSNSCTEEKDIYIDNPTKWHTHDFKVSKGDWKWDDKDASYFYEFSYPELTNFVATAGTVTAATLIDGTYRPLEYTTYFLNENGQYCAETVNFEYGTNFVRFNIVTLDLFDNAKLNFQPNTFQFKVNLSWEVR